MRYLGTRDVPIGELGRYPGNPRVHAATVLAESAATNGQYRSVVARQLDDGTLQLLAGHGTTDAFAGLGADLVRVEVIEADDTEARRIVLADNRTNDLAGYDDALLAELLKAAQPDLAGTGFDQDYFDALIAGLYDPAPGGADPDDAPDVPAAARTQPGDVWVLGAHRLVCGDAADPGALAAVMAGGSADVMWTDPPYGVEIVGGSHAIPAKERRAAGRPTIRHDDAAGLPVLLAGAFKAATKVLEPGAPWYVAHPPGALHTVFAAAIVEAGWSLRQTLVWVKDTLVLSHADYHYRHEPIYYYGFTRAAKGRLGRGGAGWYGDATATTVFDIPRPARSAVHPTMKPTELIVRCLNNSSTPAAVVLDPFAGSGSTLVAAHLTGRAARCVELDPGYCDVICARWQALTGVLPVREADGAAVDFRAAS